MTEPKHNITPDLEGMAFPVEDLVPLPDNPRRGDADAIARSMDALGHQKPVVTRLQEVDGEMVRVVLDGNHQLEAAKRLGWTHVPIVKADHLTDDEARAYSIASNRLGELGGYDTTMLADWVDTLGPDLAEIAGWEVDAVEDLMHRSAAPHMYAPTPLDDLEAEYGEPTVEDGMEIIKILVPPEVAEAWRAQRSDQEEPWQTLERLLET